jgi:hypothetical protein
LINEKVDGKRGDGDLCTAELYLGLITQAGENWTNAHVGSLGNKPKDTTILLPERSLTIFDADLIYFLSQSIFCDFR